MHIVGCILHHNVKTRRKEHLCRTYWQLTLFGPVSGLRSKNQVAIKTVDIVADRIGL